MQPSTTLAHCTTACCHGAVCASQHNTGVGPKCLILKGHTQESIASTEKCTAGGVLHKACGVPILHKGAAWPQPLSVDGCGPTLLVVKLLSKTYQSGRVGCNALL
jgi:hypothetical protein